MSLSALKRDVELVLSTLLALAVGLDLQLGRLCQVLPDLLPLVQLSCFQESKGDTSLKMNIIISYIVDWYVH